MSQKLRVLISAYSCEPNKGSELEVGWQWGLQMARFHDVTVLTRANNRQAIDAELARRHGQQPLPKFVYHDAGRLALAFKRRFKATRFYYIRWQHSAHRVVARLHYERPFDLLHHVTFATFRFPTAIWGHGVPSIWGPVGGIESIPLRLLPWNHPKSLPHELVRNLSNLLQLGNFSILRQRTRRSTAILASTSQMQEAFAFLGVSTQLMPTIGLEAHTIPPPRRVVGNGPLKILFAGNIITLKGIDLALYALKESQTDARFTLVGDGSYLAEARKLAFRLGLDRRVEFRGRLPRSELLKMYCDFELFLFPSLHDSGGYTVIEAMSNQLPVICLDTGGPRSAVQDGCGIKVPLGSHREVIAGLAGAIRFYGQNRTALVEHGQNARSVILRDYDWNKKAEQMNAVYQTLIDQREPTRLRVLLSAYGCEPDKGSEPEVGWQQALQMAKFHDITVVTRANNRQVIEKRLATYDGAHPEFIYYDLPQWVLALKRRGMWVAIYYFLWQLGVRFHLRRKIRSFDLIHHTTFNSFRQPGFWWFCPKPVVLGPLGGGQICPWKFLPWSRVQIVAELLRSFSVLNSYVFPYVYVSFYFADKILVANEDTGQCVPWLFRGKIERMLETAVTEQQVVESKPERNWSGVRLLWIGRLDKLKGGELAICAFAEAVSKFPSLTLTIVGAGREEQPLKRLVRKLALEKSVNWLGQVPKAQVMEVMRRHDAFVFTSLRDTSGNVVLEAMAAGLPVTTLLHQGAAEITTNETAIRVPLASRSETVTQLSNAILTLAQSPALRDKMGAAGRERIKERYLWQEHAGRMDRIYRRVFKERRITTSKRQEMWQVIWSPKGILLTIAALFLIGALGFYSVTDLKRQASLIVNDTLPGLSYAGAANANLAEGFNRTCLILMTDNPDEHERYLKEIEEYNQITTVYLNAYSKTIFDEKKDRDLYETLMQRRNQYLELRKQILILIDNRRQSEAIALWKTSLLPAYKQYKEAGEELLEYNMRQGKVRGENIMRYCLLTQFLVAAFGIGLFIVGFMLGIFR